MRDFPELLNKQIFLIEDDPALVERLESLCEHITHKEVIWAGSKEEALDILNQNVQFDLVIIDIMLPDTQEKRIENEKKFKEWIETEEKIQKYDNNSKNGQSKNELIDKRDILAYEIKKNISPDSSVELLSMWKKNYTNIFHITNILILTARDDNGLKDEIKKILEDKKYGWLTKPVAITELCNMLCNLLSEEK